MTGLLRGFAGSILVGVISALAGNVIIWSLLLLFDPTSEPQYAVVRAFWLTARLGAYLLAFGVVLGATFRSVPRKPVLRLVLIAVLSVVGATGATLGFQMYEVRRWERRFMDPQFAKGTTEAEIVRALGPPSHLDRLGPQRSAERPCFDESVRTTLTYAHPSTGPFRSFHFSDSGRLVCESIGWRHLWS